MSFREKNIFEANKNSNKKSSGDSVKPHKLSWNVSKTSMTVQNDGTKTHNGGNYTGSKRIWVFGPVKLPSSKCKKVTKLWTVIPSHAHLKTI